MYFSALDVVGSVAACVDRHLLNDEFRIITLCYELSMLAQERMLTNLSLDKLNRLLDLVQDGSLQCDILDDIHLCSHFFVNTLVSDKASTSTREEFLGILAKEKDTNGAPDFDHQFIEAEKFDAKPTYKKFLGYRPGVAVIGDMIVGIENSDGNTNVRFHQKDTLRRFFERIEQKGLTVNRFRADCGSCSEEIVEEVGKHCMTFYIRANRCGSLYDDIFALRGWKREELGGIEFELNSILVEKWKGRAYRLVIQRQKRIDGEIDLWEGEYTYRCILTNDYESSEKEIVKFYNLRGGKERIFDEMNNGFGWNRLPKSFMGENTVFLLLTALIRNFYKFIMARLDVKRFGLKATSRIKTFVFKFISVPAKWVRTSRQYVLNIYSCNNAYADVFQNDFG